MLAFFAALANCGETKAAATQNTYSAALTRIKRDWQQIQDRSLNVKQDVAARERIMQDCRAAVLLQPPNAKSEDSNTVRFCQCYLHWIVGEYYEAAVLADFLARQYPQHKDAHVAVKIALSAYSKLIDQSPASQQCNGEYDPLASLCRYIVERWPTTDEADEAVMLLIRIAIARHDLDPLPYYLSKMSPDSPRRAETELAVGQALWAFYLQAEHAAGDKRPSAESLQKRRAQVESVLQDGIERARKLLGDDGEVPYSVATGVLSLTQLCVDAGQPEQAIKWLEDRRIGPVELIQANDPVTNVGDFRVETLKVAVAAYAAKPDWRTGAKTIITLEKACSDASLAKIYLSLASQFEEAWKRRLAANETTEATIQAKNLTFVLDRLAGRPEQELDFNTLHWMAETLAELAAESNITTEGLSADNAAHLRKAIAIYRRALEKHSEGTSAEVADGIRLRIAQGSRRLGECGQAMNALLEILKKRPDLIDVQREAALVYQAWGRENPDYYLMAIKGGHPTGLEGGPGDPLVWGWAKMAKTLQSQAAQQAAFHEARHNLALCRFLYGQSKPETERAVILNQAKKEILLLKRLYPDLGGVPWQAKNESLLRQIDGQLEKISPEQSKSRP